MYVCMYACMYVCMYVNTNTYTHRYRVADSFRPRRGGIVRKKEARMVNSPTPADVRDNPKWGSKTRRIPESILGCLLAGC